MNYMTHCSLCKKFEKVKAEIIIRKKESGVIRETSPVEICEKCLLELEIKIVAKMNENLKS